MLSSNLNHIQICLVDLFVYQKSKQNYIGNDSDSDCSVAHETVFSHETCGDYIRDDPNDNKDELLLL